MRTYTYINCQRASGIKIGSRVKVKRMNSKHDMEGWIYNWVVDMNSCIGKEYVVSNVDGDKGIQLEGSCYKRSRDNSENYYKGDYDFYFPYYVLEIVPERTYRRIVL